MATPVTLSSVASAALENGASAAGSAAGASATPGETPFSGVLEDALHQMGQLEADAASKVDGVLQGTGVDVQAAMIATERSDLAFEMALAVRGKAVAAYEQLNQMQF